MTRSSLISALLAVAIIVSSGSAYAQPQGVNIYRYVLDIDVPESPALVALDAVGTHVLRGSSPKPIAGTIAFQTTSTNAYRAGAGIDIVPYYLLGGGKRSLASYRSMKAKGRVLRVITKTSFSIAALRDGSSPEALRLGLALRTTFHDPHDPISTTKLPETIDSALTANGISEGDLNVEQLGDRGVDLRPIYAAARREVSKHRDVQVTGGWGMSSLADGAVLDADSVRGVRHTFWLTGQHAFGPRLDLLVTAQLRTASGIKAKPRFGLGIQRKSQAADYRAELYYDRASRRLNPGVSAELRAGNGVGVAAAIGTDSELGPERAPRIIRATLLLRWYATSERW